MTALRLSLRGLVRGWHSGELRALGLAVLVAVTAITSVGFFTSRIQQALQHQAGELLAADLRVQSGEPIPAPWAARAQELGLRSARALTFASVVLAGERTQLAAVKAVGEAYPLRGTLRVADQAYGAGRPVRHGPAPGTVWLESRLLNALALEPGDTLELGAATLRVGRVLIHEPDRGGELFNVAPRLLLHQDDLPATELLQPASRVNHYLLVAGEAGGLRRFRAWVEPRLAPGQLLQGVRDARPELRAALDRGQRFLGLAALVAVLLAGVAVAIAARRFAARRLDDSAILRCLGAEQALVNRLYVLQMTWLGLAAGAAGTALGFGAQYGLAYLLEGLVGGELPPPSAAPALTGMAAGLVTLYGFALPPLMRLGRVPPIRVLRRDIDPVPPGVMAVYGSAMAAMAALTLWQAADLELASAVLAGGVATLAVLAAGAWLLVRAFGGLRHGVGATWRFGLAGLARRAGGTTAQVLAFGLGIMALLLLTLIRGDLLEDWHGRLPPGAPNQFAINIQTQQLPGIRAFFRERGQEAPGLYPMVRGRLVAIDGRRVKPEDYPDGRARRLVAREFNLTWLERPQTGNRVIAGRWWSKDTGERQVLSVEQGIAETLGIGLGDTLTYRIAGRELQARVTSLRHVEWETFRPNFFVAAPPGLLDDFPATWICSFHLPAREKDLLSDLVRAFPNVTIIDVEALMGQVRTIMDRVSLAVEYVFGFTLLAGLIVLYSAVQASHDQRLREGAILRTLGADRRQLLLGTVAEFTAIGLLAGVLGALGASAAAYVIAEHVLGLAFDLRVGWWLSGMLGGVLGVGIAGTLGTRAVLKHPPLQILRKV